MVLCTGVIDWAIAVPSISGTHSSTAAPSRNASCLLTCLVLIVGLAPHSQGSRISSFSLTLQSNQITVTADRLWEPCRRGESGVRRNIYIFSYILCTCPKLQIWLIYISGIQEYWTSTDMGNYLKMQDFHFKLSLIYLLGSGTKIHVS